MCVAVRLHADPLRRQLCRCDLPKTALSFDSCHFTRCPAAKATPGVWGGERHCPPSRGVTHTARTNRVRPRVLIAKNRMLIDLYVLMQRERYA